MASVKVLAIFGVIFLMSSVSHGRNSEESFLMLREAMMDSNADYNKHKKQMNNEETSRADSWNERGQTVIHIGAGETAAANSFQAYNEEISDEQGAFRNDRDVSSNRENEEN